jgi:RNA polymerase sigma-70 factor (ECF subfamily)
MTKPPAPKTHDAAAWLQEHGDILFQYARSRVLQREQAEDLVQETLMAAIQSFSRFEGRSTVRTWLLAILKLKIIDHHRRISAAHPGPADDLQSLRDRSFNEDDLWRVALADWKAKPDVIEAREFRDVLHSCLGKLPRSLASAFVLRELEELEVDDIQKTLGLTASNLRIRLHRARLLLRDCLQRNWFDGDLENPRRTSVS